MAHGKLKSIRKNIERHLTEEQRKLHDEMFRKRHHQITPRRVAEFLIFDNKFPRSIHHCVEKAKVCLQRITGPTSRIPRNSAEKKLGRLEADLTYTDIDEVIESGMHEYLDNLQTRLNRVDRAIATIFFNIKPVPRKTATEQ